MHYFAGRCLGRCCVRRRQSHTASYSATRGIDRSNSRRDPTFYLPLTRATSAGRSPVDGVVVPGGGGFSHCRAPRRFVVSWSADFAIRSVRGNRVQTMAPRQLAPGWCGCSRARHCCSRDFRHVMALRSRAQLGPPALGASPRPEPAGLGRASSCWSQHPGIAGGDRVAPFHSVDALA